MFQPQVDPRVFSLFDAIAFIASVVSLVVTLVLGGVAIWLAIAHKRDADKVNSETARLLGDIRSETKAITHGVWDELHAYGVFARNTIEGTSTGPESRVASPTELTATPAPDLPPSQ